MLPQLPRPTRWSLPLVMLLLLLSNSELGAQRNADRARQRVQELREDSWPPPRVYNRVSLGYALQEVFRKHFQFCGFVANDEQRDFLPSDINKFLGRRDLRTRVERADISGGSLLNYVFTQYETMQPLNAIRYRASNLLRLEQTPNQFVVNPAEQLDAFLLTKNCSGYLKAALDAGIEPPYAAFKTALSTDDRRESTVVAVSGAFISPISAILEARDARTTELMLRLWQFYQQNPQLIGRAYYLREYQGVMIRHLTSADEVYKNELELGINVNLPLAARLKGQSTLGRAGANSFKGTDWQTIVYTDFEGPYSRADLFAALPSPRDISAYFQQLRLVFQKPRDFPFMTEGAEHRHYLTVEGIPAEISQQAWVIEEIGGGVYAQPPRLQVDHYREADGSYGARFTVTGQPHAQLFKGVQGERPGSATVQYRLRTTQAVGGYVLGLDVREEVQTSAHPIVRLTDGNFDLRKQEDRRFAFQWRCALELEDTDNPVNFELLPTISNLLVRRPSHDLEVYVARIEPDARRHLIYVTLETRTTWPLDQIDDRNMVNYNVSFDLHLQGKRTQSPNVRPVKGILSFPSIRPVQLEIPPPVNVNAPTSESGNSGGMER